VLLTEPPHNPTSHREQLAEAFFETFRAPALFLAPPAVLSLYASGRTTGVVLDVGEGVTHCIPVYEGYALPHSIVRSDIAGMDVTNRLQLLLRKSGTAFSTTAESDFCSVMKEEVCYVSNVPSGYNEVDYFTEEKATTGAGDTSSKAKYQLPDGQVIDLSYERHRSSEVLFEPSLIGSEERPIHDVLLTSILQSDMDLRSTLFSNIILSGGSTLLPGLGDRLLYEVRSRAPERTKIRISAPPERRESSWVGGSILASLTTFKNMWVGRSEYEEYGSSVLYRGSL
jgi:centractin